MSSFRPSSPPPPSPPSPPHRAPGTRTKAESSSEVAWVIDQAHTVAAKGLSWCADVYQKKSVPHPHSDDSFDAPFLALGALTVCVVGCDPLGLAQSAMLPLKAKIFVVNLWGFARPALATGGGAYRKTKKLDNNNTGSTLLLLSSPSSFANYWVSE